MWIIRVSGVSLGIFSAAPQVRGKIGGRTGFSWGAVSLGPVKLLPARRRSSSGLLLSSFVIIKWNGWPFPVRHVVGPFTDPVKFLQNR